MKTELAFLLLTLVTGCGQSGKRSAPPPEPSAFDGTFIYDDAHAHVEWSDGTEDDYAIPCAYVASDVAEDGHGAYLSLASTVTGDVLTFHATPPAYPIMPQWQMTAEYTADGWTPLEGDGELHYDVTVTDQTGAVLTYYAIHYALLGGKVVKKYEPYECPAGFSEWWPTPLDPARDMQRATRDLVLRQSQ